MDHPPYVDSPREGPCRRSPWYDSRFELDGDESGIHGGESAAPYANRADV